MNTPLFQIPRIRSILPLAATSLLFASWAPTSSAQLFLAPNTGTHSVLISHTTPNADDARVMSSYPVMTLYFGGLSLGAPTISTNGNIYLDFYAPADDHLIKPFFDPIAAPHGGTHAQQISPLWQDLALGTSGVVTETYLSGSYYAVSWQNMEVHDAWMPTPSPAPIVSFQAILFQNSTTLNGVQFQTGDIVFSYEGMGAAYPNINEFIVGIQNQFNASATAPGSGTYHMNGTYSHNYGIPEFQVGINQYILFRASGMGYNTSIQTIPEPSTMAALMSGSLLLVYRRFRRRSA